MPPQLSRVAAPQVTPVNRVAQASDGARNPKLHNGLRAYANRIEFGHILIGRRDDLGLFGIKCGVLQQAVAAVKLDAAFHLAPQHDQLLPERSILDLKPPLIEDASEQIQGQRASAIIAASVNLTGSMRMRLSVHTTATLCPHWSTDIVGTLRAQRGLDERKEIALLDLPRESHGCQRYTLARSISAKSIVATQ
jgi:hypothetical protein